MRVSMRGKRFRGGLVSRAHRLLYDSTLGLRVIKKKNSLDAWDLPVRCFVLELLGRDIPHFWAVCGTVGGARLLPPHPRVVLLSGG